MSDEGVETFSQTKEFFYTDGILTGYELGGQAYVQYETDTMGNPVKIIRGNSALVNVPPVEQTLSWGEGRMLLGISQDEDNHIEYTYNADGLRTYQVVTENGVSIATRYVWGNNGLAAVISNGQMVVPLYDDNGEAVGFMVATVNEDPRLAPTEEVYTYVKNLQGDVIRILDGDGTAVVVYTYDPWGVPTVHGDADLAAINPCSYRGYYYDEETGYYYLQSRYYDPEIGRFINADDVAFIDSSGNMSGKNIFTYCSNNPIINMDYAGYLKIPAIAISISIDAVILWIASAFNVTWLGITAPLKAVSKKVALSLFKNIVAPKVRGFAGTIINLAVKALNWIGRTALAASINVSVTQTIGTLLSNGSRFLSACLSLGGLLAAIADIRSDNKFDGWIRI